MLKSTICLSEECVRLKHSCSIVLRVRSALRAGDWIDSEAQMKGWETMALDPYALDELKRVEIELEDRNVVNCLELYVLYSSEGAAREWKHCSYRHSDFYDLITL